MPDTAADLVHLSRLRWRCRRGMRELDVLFMQYFEQHYRDANGEQQQAFEALLELQDPLILAYLTGAQTPDQQAIKDVIYQLTRINART